MQTMTWYHVRTEQEAADIITTKLEGLSFNTWSDTGHLDKQGRPICIIGHRGIGAQRSTSLAGLIFVGSHREEIAANTRLMLQKASLLANGEEGTAWLPSCLHKEQSNAR